jgi:hypothetical protein
MKRQCVTVRLSVAQVLRLERLGESLWPGEQLELGEVIRRLVLEHMLWAESERGMVERAGI